jgi:hypothetical protein
MFASRGTVPHMFDSTFPSPLSYFFRFSTAPRRESGAINHLFTDSWEPVSLDIEQYISFLYSI